MPDYIEPRLLTLYRKFFAKTISVAELQEFSEMLNDNGAEGNLFQLLDTDFQLSESQLFEIDEFRAEQIFNNITTQPQYSSRIRKIFPRMAIAASIAGAFLLVSTYFLINYIKDNQATVASISVKNDIPPGKPGATLILANGKRIILSDTPEGEVANESGVTISKPNAGELVYNAGAQNTSPGGINTLATANAQSFRVRLPDGSVVWLNAASSLKFYASFTGLKTRTVELDGEAYFEVARDVNHPFIVKSKTQQVQVLGTHFNVKTYHDDQRAITTLKEGSVKVSYMASTWNEKIKIGYPDEIVLKPGQQSDLSGDQLHISKVDTEIPLAWKNGDFIFDGSNITDIMRDISRWYNIEVVYQGTVPKGSFSGNISRTKNISQILKALETTRLVHFKIEGRRVIVSN